jgi:hypothetical protein
MPLTCPSCNSENVVIVSRVLVEQSVAGEPCGPQEWEAADVIWDTIEVAFGQCKDCGERLGVRMIGEFVAALWEDGQPVDESRASEAARRQGGLLLPSPPVVPPAPEKPFVMPPEPTFTHDENNAVQNVYAFLETHPSAVPVKVGARVGVILGPEVQRSAKLLAVAAKGAVTCRADAYEHYREKLGLPLAEVLS